MPAANDAAVYQRMLRHITRLVAAIGIAGAIAAAFLKGPRFSAGFVLGAALSGLSLWRWKKVADSLTGATKPRSALGWVMQFILLIGGAFVIIRYLEVTPVAVFLGLLVSAAAILVSIVIELIWNMKSG